MGRLWRLDPGHIKLEMALQVKAKFFCDPDACCIVRGRGPAWAMPSRSNLLAQDPGAGQAQSFASKPRFGHHANVFEGLA